MAAPVTLRPASVPDARLFFDWVNLTTALHQAW
jgi:hypothetical protein